MLSSDLDFAHELTIRENWGNTRDDLAEILGFNPRGCFMYEVSGESVGMVMTTRYDRFAFLGNLIIADGYRGERRGEDLTKHALRFLEGSGIETVMLDAVEKAAPMYERLGFRKVCRSFRLKGSIKSLTSESIRKATLDDLQSISEIDRKHFGADRTCFLQKDLNSDACICRALVSNEQIVGYIFANKKSDFVWLGPWVISDETVRDEEMLKDAAALFETDSQRLGVLETNRGAVSCAEKCGFEIAGFSWRMVRG
ncbi:MAG: GNAT family N-acetyltransferase, partial [Candidatus Thorarchaeota archaeon]